MDKAAISSSILKHAGSIADHIASLDVNLLNQPTEGRWSAAENTVHLIKSVAPINVALSLPKFTLLMFGTSDASRSYEEIIELYRSELAAGAKASKAYIPRTGRKADPHKLTLSLMENYRTFVKKLGEWTESDLDRYRLPHPILGKLTIREMAYFTIYHLEHHFGSIRKAAE